LSFDGVDDFAATTSSSTSVPGGNASYTEELRFMVTAWKDYGSGYNAFLLSRGAEGPRQGVHIVLINHHIGLSHWGLDRDTGVSVELDRWYHLATTWDGSTETLYLDGAPVWQEAAPAGLSVASSPIAIGKHVNYSSFYFPGYLDDVRIWNVARTAEEIAASAAASVWTLDDTIVLWWRMDETSGQVLTDESATHTDAVLGASVEAASDDPTRVAP
jgi:hypothetical protein